MSGIDEILNIIDSQQKQTENNIIRSAEEKARGIEAEGDSKAEKAYNDYMKKALQKAENDYKMPVIRQMRKTSVRFLNAGLKLLKRQ